MALLPVLGPSLSKTLGLRDGVVVLLLLSEIVFEFSTVTFRLILDILQGLRQKFFFLYYYNMLILHIISSLCLSLSTLIRHNIISTER